MKKGLCEIIIVADRSGSMGSIRNDAIGSFNAFLEDQKKHPGEALLTYTQFDGEYEIVYSGKPIKDVQPLNEETFVPRGSTALLDAVGRTIDEVGKRLHNTPEDQRPERVLMVILTDGGENASHTFSREQIFDKIKHQRDIYKWEFVFLAAGQEAFAEAQAIGIVTANIVAYSAGDADQHVGAIRKMSNATYSYRSGGSASVS